MKIATCLFVFVLLMAQPIVVFAFHRGQALFSPDGRILADPQEDATIVLRDVASGNKIATLYDPYRHDPPLSIWHSVRLSFSPDSKLLATQRTEEPIVLWRVSDGTKLTSLSRPRFDAFPLQFSADSKRILAIGKVPRGPGRSSPRMITVWEVATQKELLHVDLGENAGFERAVFSPDGKMVMAYLGQQLKVRGPDTKRYMSDKHYIDAIKLWDIERAEEIATLKASSATSASFAPDGKFLLIEDAAFGPRAWDIREGKMRPLREGIDGASQHSSDSGPRPHDISADNVAESIGNDKWNWTVFINGDPQTVDRVKCVQYTLHESFPDPVRLICDRGEPKRPFALSATGWGTFNIGIRIFMKDGSHKDLEHRLKF